ncbi:MAG: glycosyltransferase family 1 protein [Patescibacteria group bacterium]
MTTLHDVGFEEYAHLYSTKTIGPNNKILKSLIKLLVKIISCGSYSTTELDYHRWSARLAKKKASAITTVSEFSKREIQKKLTIAGDRIHVVYPAPGKQYYRREDQTRINCIVRKYSIFSSYILYIGRIEYKKNVDTIIKGFSLYKRQQNSDSVKLVLAGKPGYGFDAIKKSILSERLDDDVILPGWVDEIDLPFLMCGAKMFIFPSRYEGFGIPIIESMSCGTPVITSNRGAMKEVAGDAAMLVDPDDPQSIANGINRVLTDDGYRTALIERGRKRSKEFSWHESAVQMIHLLKR